jgi:hypothetical protein
MRDVLVLVATSIILLKHRSESVSGGSMLIKKSIKKEKKI